VEEAIDSCSFLSIDGEFTGKESTLAELRGGGSHRLLLIPQHRWGVHR